MTSIVVCFSGRIGIGKTSASKALAERLNCPWTGFGDYIRSVATNRGLNPDDRDEMQELGASLIDEHGFEWLCGHVIAAARWPGDCPLVVDGIRHAEAFQTIRRLLPSHRTVLILLMTDSEEALGARLTERGIDPALRAKWEAHSTETQVLSNLPMIANLVVSANLPVDKVTAQIMSFIEE